jgi:hypothetical protein
VFGRREIRKREREEREVGQRRTISPVLLGRESGQRDKMMWDPCLYHFSP